MKILTILQAKESLEKTIPQDIKDLAKVFKDNDFSLFLVGGCIRDTFLGLEPKDFDVCTNASPDQIKTVLNSVHIKFTEQGDHFGVIVAKLSEDVEIATFRTDISQDTGNNKDTIVKIGATIEEDVMRRDLTINGLFMNLSTNTIIDLVDGINDLKNGIVRCIGNPIERFKEDNLRKLRVIRFACRFDFKIDPDTFNAIIKDPSLNISNERIVNELQSTFDKTKPENRHLIGALLNVLGLDIVIFGCKFNKSHFADVSFNEFIFMCIGFNNQNFIETKLSELKFSSNTIDSVLFLNKLLLLLTDNEVIDPLWFFKTTQKLKIDKINIFFSDKISWLFNFKPDKNLTKQLMDKGLKGADLGEAINKHNKQLFIDTFM